MSQEAKQSEPSDLPLKVKEEEKAVSEPQDIPNYGSTDSSASSQGIAGHGGILNLIPTQGYCLVFEQEKEYGFGSNKTAPYLITFADNTLQIDMHPDLKGGRNEYTDDGWEANLQQALGVAPESNGPYDLLSHFKSANISYHIESDRIEKYFYVIIATTNKVAEDWADKHKIDVPIDARSAIMFSRDEFPEFKLAQRTRIDASESKTFAVPDRDKPFNKLETSDWDNIHIEYNTSISSQVYYRQHGSIMTHRLYLRILYEMLTDDVVLGGANFIVTKHLSNKHHPLMHFFALHQGPTERPLYKQQNAQRLKCRTPSVNLAFCDAIRDYYGENVGFYFHFLIHYTKWLYPMAGLGLIWFIIQMSVSKTYGIATPGSTIIVLLAIMWSTLMIENWYRREWKLRFAWGMMRYKQTEIPRPTFKGQLTVSPMTGHIIETYTSWYGYCCKITFSMSTMLLCVAIVVAIVATLFLLRGQNRSDTVLTIGIGMANSIQIFVMNKLYTWLAYQLNEWEGHRLQQDYYNNLVIKRIIFIIFNSFYSLFYIAFFDDNPLYDDDTVRLEAVRTQLITLFAMAIFLQNSMEIFFPWLGARIAKKCAKKEQQEYDEENHPKHQAQAGLLSGDYTADSSEGVYVGVGVGGVEHIVMDEEVKPSMIMKDIEEQIQLGPSPDVLDNTAEIVVLHGYIMLFVIIFPLMPFLATLNNYIELRVDSYNLLNAKRPVPSAAAGLGVWKSVLSCFNIIAVFSNLAILTFRTDLISNILLDLFDEYNFNTDVLKTVFFFCAVLFLLLVIFLVRIVVDDQSQSTREAIARQDACERHLLQAPVQKLAKKAKRAKSKKKLRSKRKIKVDDQKDNDV